MLNIEKYADKIREELEINSLITTINKFNGKYYTCFDCEMSDCVSCEVKAFDWLISEAKEECHNCKHHGKIEGKENVFACLHEGQVLEKSDDVACEFWEV